MESIKWFIEDQVFSLSYDLAPPPTPPPSPISKLTLFLSLPVCRQTSLLVMRGVRRGWGRSQIIQPWDSLVLYKSFSTHCPHRCMNNLQIHAAYYHMSIIWISRALRRVLTIDMLTIWIIWWLYTVTYISLPFSGICVYCIPAQLRITPSISGAIRAQEKGGAGLELQI